MKRRLLIVTLSLLLGFSGGAFALTASDYQGGLAWRATTGAQAGNVIFGITPTGRLDLIGGATLDNTTAGTFTVTETNISLVGAVSFTGSSAFYGAAQIFGYDSGAYVQLAVSDTTGNLAITHAGSTKNVAWTTTGTFGVTSGDVTFDSSGDFLFLMADDLTFTVESAGGIFAVGGTAGSVLNIATDDTTADDINIGSAKDDVLIAGEDISLDTADDADVAVADDFAVTMESAGGIFSVDGTPGFVVNVATDDTTADDINVGSAKDDITLAGEDITLTTADDLDITSTTAGGIISLGGVAGQVFAIGTDDTAADDIDIGSAKDDLDLEGEDITLDTADDADVAVADDFTVTMESASGIFAIAGTPGFVVNVATDDTTADDINVGSAKDDITVAGEDITLTTADDLDITSTTAGGVIALGGVAGQVFNIGVDDTAADTIAVGSAKDDVLIAGEDISLDTADDADIAVADDFTVTMESAGGIFAIGGTAGSVYNLYIDDTTADDINIGSAKDDVEIAAEDITFTSADDVDITSTTASGIIYLGGTPGVVINIGTDDTTADTITIGSDKDTTTLYGAIVLDDTDAGVTITSDNQTHASATLTIPDFVDSTADVLTTNLFSCVVPFHGGLFGEDTDGVGTNGGGLVGAGSIDTTTYDYNSGAAGANDVLVKCYDAGDVAWDDLSTSATLTGWSNNYQLQPDAASEAIGDAVAIGFDEKFCEFAFNDLATGNGALATYTNDAGKWQYSTGAGTWSDLTVYDGTDATAQDGKRPFQQTGAISFAPPSAWVVATYDGEEAYWVQWVFTAAELTQTAIIDDTNKDEPLIPFPSDGLPSPFKLTVTDVRVTNVNATVHNQNCKFIVGNFTDGLFSNEVTWAASQVNDTFTLSTTVACDPGDVIGILCTDDGGAGTNPNWAVELTVDYED